MYKVPRETTWEKVRVKVEMSELIVELEIIFSRHRNII